VLLFSTYFRTGTWQSQDHQEHYIDIPTNPMLAVDVLPEPTNNEIASAVLDIPRARRMEGPWT